ncbi:M20/M25/M40 family metallo-hydrolase [Aliikangiella maris]|uniref:M20/M25/M40 family metallo-hydrolase n=2 Tax=Aliikangiella maris TaxID=3162458 RepID=A0ABV2BY95_9GAMM
MNKNIMTLLALGGMTFLPPAFTQSQSGLTSQIDDDENQVWVSIGTDAYDLITQKYTTQFDFKRANIRNASHGNVAVVQMAESKIPQLSKLMHDEFHRCGGFIFHDTFTEAHLFATAPSQIMPSVAVNYTINNSAAVNALVNQLSTTNLTSTVNTLKNYHNRYYTQQSGVDAANWIKDKWQSISNGRSDISVETYGHSWNQPSVIATITGTTNPNEIVVVGGHLDSINQSNASTGRAPGADDNASGIAVLTETLRAIVASGFKPERTVKIMGYAAEEVGLRGSKAIAQSYKSSGKNVIGVAQFDMSGYKGNQSADIVFVSDYTNNAQNQFMGQLVDTYQSGVTHETSQCGYACSDHASWNNEGFAASFPAEARINNSNPNIHTANDTSYSVSHSIKFARLSAAYVAELAKGSTDGTPPPPPPPPPPGGSSELQNGVAKTNLSANSGNELNYTFDVPAGATDIKVEMSGGTGDADLYVRFGSAPTDATYDCRPYKSGNAESCSLNQAGGRYYVRLKAYSNFSGVTLKGSYTGSTTPPPPPPPPPGGNDPINETINDVSVSQGQWQHYTQELGSGYSTMTVEISGGTGDADLYVRHGAQPTSNSYDCRPYKNGNSELCTMNNPASGTWYISLYGYSSTSGITLNLKAN